MRCGTATTQSDLGTGASQRLFDSYRLKEEPQGNWVWKTRPCSLQNWYQPVEALFKNCLLEPQGLAKQRGVQQVNF